IFYYIYGILNTPSYRTKYTPTLRQDFPRIPFPNGVALFGSMAKLGRLLASYHLLRDARVLDTSTRAVGTCADKRIVKPTYVEQERRVYFNDVTKTSKLAASSPSINEATFWVGGIITPMWEYEMGNIQQLKQWLEGRRYSAEPKEKHITRAITDAELQQFLQICNAIEMTLHLYPKLDAVYGKIDEDPFSFPPIPAESTEGLKAFDLKDAEK
nr:type ISP restriction/modification enzyme [Candidatus Sigynarchaeota archaeon]